MTDDFIRIVRGDLPLVVAVPHAGTDIPVDIERQFVSPWLARKDTDWWVDRLYDFAGAIGATMVSTRISRSVIDVNRDPSGASLYPGQATTELCPTTSFAGEPLYSSGLPDADEIARRRTRYFDPYHHALASELDRLHARHGRVVLYDAHSIASRIGRLFDGELPEFNMGTNGGTTCDPALEAAVVDAVASTGRSHVLNGRFRGGWTTRHYGRPRSGCHAVQMELAIRAYLTEPCTPTPETWPPPFDPASPLIDDLQIIVATCAAFARS